MKPRIYFILNWLSIFSIFMLFVLGGLVRSTGSGMGCPDWPKCFDQYIPPTSEKELPKNYQTYYKEKRLEKTKRFVSFLNFLGMNDKANKISKNSQLNQTHQFNALKAYVEYVNRIWGAMTGFIVFFCLVFSCLYFKSNPAVFIYSLLGFIAVLLNALLGAIVVNSNLIGGIVTIHFIAAFASISFFILARRKIENNVQESEVKLPKISLVVMILATIQILMGALVREKFDLLTLDIATSQIIQSLNPNLFYHGVLGVILLCGCILQFIQCSRLDINAQYIRWVMFLSIGQIIIGPLSLIDTFIATSKLFHISFGAGIYVLQFYICSTYLRGTKS